MRKSDHTRSRIERTALALFAEKGVDQTTTRDIAQGAEIAEGTIYRHFSGKEDLIAGIFARHYAALAEELDSLQREERGIDAKLAVMIRRFCGLFDSDPDLFRFLFFVQHGQLEKLPKDAANPVRVIREVIAGAMEATEIPKRDPDLATAWVLGAVLQPAVFRIYGRLERPLAELCGDTAAACSRMLRG